MYEDQTFEVILQRMLDRLPSDIDKREGSVMYIALAPIAIELAQLYIELDVNIKLYFAKTSSGEYLILRSAEQGVEWNAATKAQRKGIFYGANNALMDVSIGSRFSIGDLTYAAISKISTGIFALECETTGTTGNGLFGTLLPIQNISGLVSAELADVLVPGDDGETDDELCTRFLEAMQQPGVSGSKENYIAWAKTISSIVNARTFPRWNGPNTLKLILLSSDKRSPSQAKVDEVAAYIETVRPIVVNVTVTGATEVPIDISVKLSLKTDGTSENAKPQITETETAYFKSIAFDDTVVRYSKIAEAILAADDVLDYENLTINGGTGNIQLTAEQVAVLGAITILS